MSSRGSLAKPENDIGNVIIGISKQAVVKNADKPSGSSSLRWNTEFMLLGSDLFGFALPHQSRSIAWLWIQNRGIDLVKRLALIQSPRRGIPTLVADTWRSRASINRQQIRRVKSRDWLLAAPQGTAVPMTYGAEIQRLEESKRHHCNLFLCLYVTVRGPCVRQDVVRYEIGEVVPGSDREAEYRRERRQRYCNTFRRVHPSSSVERACWLYERHAEEADRQRDGYHDISGRFREDSDPRYSPEDHQFASNHRRFLTGLEPQYHARLVQPYFEMESSARRSRTDPVQSNPVSGGGSHEQLSRRRSGYDALLPSGYDEETRPRIRFQHWTGVEVVELSLDIQYQRRSLHNDVEHQLCSSYKIALLHTQVDADPMKDSAQRAADPHEADVLRPRNTNGALVKTTRQIMEFQSLSLNDY
nr:hypothetical protein CFP56_74954 [Quercus suber]